MTIPGRFFHYTSKEPALEHILPSRKIRLGSIGCTNDPRETKEWGFSISDISRDASEGSNSLSFLEEMNQIQKIANRIRLEEWWVFCLCQNNPDLKKTTPNQVDLTHFKYGYARPRMWAQYAQNHQGICMEFDGTVLQEAIKDTVNASGEIFQGAVEYADEWDRDGIRKRADAFQIPYQPLKDPGFEEGLRNHIRQNYKHFFLWKSCDWSSEKEFRWLVHSKSGPFYVDISTSLRSVIVGVDFPIVYGPSLWQLCGGFNVRVERMSWNNRVPIKHPWTP